VKPNNQSRANLLLNHFDAWVVTLTIGVLALVNHNAINRQTTFLLVAVTVGYWLAFAVNDYFDAPFDALEEKKAQGNFFVQRGKQVWRQRPFLFILLFINLLLLVAFAQYGRRGLAILFICYAVLWAYSAPPFRLKNRPGVDLLIHALFVESFVYFVFLFLLEITWTAVDYAVLTIAFLSSLAAQIEQQIRDYEVDKRTGGTFTTAVGRRPATLLLKIVTLALFTVVVGGFLNGTLPLFMLPLALLALPLILNRVMGKTRPLQAETMAKTTVALTLTYTTVLFFYHL
jgi:lycopene elongase/hydratase (dihydrobisanhydrobacterioruberin-forming)